MGLHLISFFSDFICRNPGEGLRGILVEKLCMSIVALRAHKKTRKKTRQMRVFCACLGKYWPETMSLVNYFHLVRSASNSAM